MTNKFEMAKERLVTKAANYAAQYLLNKYGEAHLIGEPIVELTSTIDPNSSSLLFNGKITVSAAGLLNNVNVDMTVNSNEIEVDSETSVQSKIESAVNAQQELEPVKASLDGFRLVDNGTTYLEVSHADLQGSKLGVLGKNEYATSKDRASLLQGMVKDAMLNMLVSFTGEFKEPVIEKVAIVKQAASDTHEHNCKECGNMWKCHKGQACNEGKNAPCGKCYAKEEFGAKKSSWLTADLFKEASVEKKADDFELGRDVTPNPLYHFEPNTKVVVTDKNGQEYHGTILFGSGPGPEESSAFYRIKLDTGKEIIVDEEEHPDLFNSLRKVASIETIAIKEDMPMARAHDSMAHMAQFEEQSDLEAQLKVEHEASNQLVSLLQGMGYGTAKTVEITSSKDGFDIMTAIDDGGAVKAVSIPVTVKEGKVILPKKALISTLIARGLDVKAKLAEQFDLDVLEKLAAIDEKLAYESQEVENILNEKQASIEKAAAGEKQPFFDSDDSTMTVQKHLLPNHEDLKVGDRLNDGTDDWEIVNEEGQQNDKNEGSSSQWTLKKVQGPERGDKKPKNKIPS